MRACVSIRPARRHLAAALAPLLLGLAGAAGAAELAAAAGIAGQSIPTVAPVFGQLLVVGVPPGFRELEERSSATEYRRQFVRQGESAQEWTQMVTITGSKALAHRPGATPASLAQNIAAGFEQACPASYHGQGLDQRTVSGFDAFMAYASCGTAPSAQGRASESVIMTVIKGRDDVYTVQWAERDAPSATPLPFTPTRWAERLSRLEPLRLCDIVPGEAAPYPSCWATPRKK